VVFILYYGLVPLQTDRILDIIFTRLSFIDIMGHNRITNKSSIQLSNRILNRVLTKVLIRVGLNRVRVGIMNHLVDKTLRIRKVIITFP